MTWTIISFPFGSTLTSAKMTQLYDNVSHVRDGNHKLVVFTASGSYTKPTGLRRIDVTVVAGGGRGSASGAGGSGGVSIKSIEESAVLSSESVTVGAGSTASATPGGTSSFGAHCSATGGQLVTGGIGIGGNINIRGGSGGTGTDTAGGSNLFGGGGQGTESGGQYGGGSGTSGTAGGNGIVIIKEFY